MANTTYVPHGLKPSKRQAKRIKRMSDQASAREAKRNAITPRAMSGLDRKAQVYGIWSESFHQMPRKERHKLVAIEHSKRLAA